MFYSAMPTLPVSSLRNNQAEVIARLNETPVLLTRDGYGTGVLVHPDKWNQLVAELARLQRIMRATKILAEMKAGNYTEEL